MKAALFRRFGGTDVLEWTDIEDPVPKRGEICVRVRASSERRNSAAAATSSGAMMPPRGCLALRYSIVTSSSWARLDIGVSTTPGAIAFTLMFCEA